MPPVVRLREGTFAVDDGGGAAVEEPTPEAARPPVVVALILAGVPRLGEAKRLPQPQPDVVDMVCAHVPVAPLEVPPPGHGDIEIHF